MYLRTTKRKRTDGSEVRYLQLAHNDWDAEAGQSRVRVIYNFGREDELDRDAIARLISSLSRALPAEQALAAGVGGDLAFVESRPMGAAYVLDALWRRLGIDNALRKLIQGTKRASEVERVLFALVANRALAPSSKLAAASWVTDDVHVPGLPEVSEDACYRAMDWLLQVEPTLAKNVYDSVADLLTLEVDLLFFDTTSTHFQIEQADEAVPRDETGQRIDAPAGDADHTGAFRTWGKSKDHRDDLPQVVIGMAVTRDGIPVRVWSWPGNTTDTALIRQVKADLRDWTLGKVVWVADRGFTSAANRRALAAGAGGYILGEKLRSGSAEATAALSRPGRYQHVAGNLRVKEVKISEHERFVVCHNPEAADRDAAIREQMLTRLRELIDDTDRLSARKRAELRGVISTKPGLHRYLRVTGGGLLRLDAAAITAEAKLDGKYLLRTSDPHLSAEDVALGYKQLAAIERAWRDMKHVIDLRPVYHRLEDRIRAHVLLCWLALLLIRITETRTGTTWHQLRPALQRLHVGTFTGPAGTYQQTTTPTAEVKSVFAALDVELPPKVLHLDPTTGPAEDTSPAA